MITGDNPLTGSNIGYKSNILAGKDELEIVDVKGDSFHQSPFSFDP